MKYPIELALIVVLVVVMYYRPAYIRELTSHPLAKLLMVGILVVITHMFGRNAGILTALIMLLMMHNVFEGMENKDETDKESDSDEDGEETDDEEEPQPEDEENEPHQIAKTTADLIGSNPGDPRNKDKMVPNPDAAGAGENSDGPVGMGKDNGKPIQEGFSLYY